MKLIKASILRGFNKLAHAQVTTRVVTGGVLAFCLGLVVLGASARYLSVIFASMTLYVLVREWPRFKAPMLTIVYPLMPLIALILLNESSYRYVLFVVWAMSAAYDIGAYLCGVLFGRTLLWPSVSPKKTWEGFFGGLCCALAIGLFLARCSNIALIVRIVVVLFFAGGAVVGDLFESWLKRRAHIKDAGDILPGHGGVMDRIDSLLLIVPFAYVCAPFLGKIFVANAQVIC